MKVWYPVGTKRYVRQFVIRKRIGDDVRYLQVCSWEEVYKTHPEYDDMAIGVNASFVPTGFISERAFHVVECGVLSPQKS